MYELPPSAATWALASLMYRGGARERKNKLALPLSLEGPEGPASVLGLRH